MLKRRVFAGGFVATFGVLIGSANGQFPGTAPITLVMPYPPGGLGDYFVRLVAPKLAEKLGVPVTIDNKAGANGAVGAAAVANAKPDGHTILFVPASTLTTNPWLMKDLAYDPLKDFTPLALVLEVPNVLVVNPDLPVRTFSDLIELARRRPATINYASVGAGSSTHLQAEMLKRAAGIDIVNITYRGAGPALQDLLGGQVQMMFDNMPSALPLIQSGKLRALAVTSAKSSAALPEVPPIGSFFPGFEDMPWFGFLGPAGLPADIATKLSTAIVQAVNSPDIVQALGARGGVIVSRTPEQLRSAIIADRDKTGRLIKEAGISLQ
ncbi:MAG: tripartite tricarboxylate transporter substrate binding protein [Rhodospirillales bacterium]|nr:tripartite tricarboxylate transporter substrate binding protein [Rhodospirillales bacterium]